MQMPSWLEIIISIFGVLFYIYKAIEPKLPANRAAEINNRIATLAQVAAAIVQEIEMESSGQLSSEQKKALAVDRIKRQLNEFGWHIPEELISTAIESTVYLIGVVQGKYKRVDPLAGRTLTQPHQQFQQRLGDHPTRQVPTIDPYNWPDQ